MVEPKPRRPTAATRAASALALTAGSVFFSGMAGAGGGNCGAGGVNLPTVCDLVFHNGAFLFEAGG